MDFLGLRTLTVIRDAVHLIKLNKGIDVDINTIPLDDPGVYEMLSQADTDGVFQLESAGMRHFLKELKPSNFEDIIAGISLYRPGPMDQIPRYIDNKNHPESIEYTDPSLTNILEVTYGCMVYQEQVMQIVRDLGATPWADRIWSGGPWPRRTWRSWKGKGIILSTASLMTTVT